MSFRDADVAAVAAVMNGLPEPTVDLRAAFGVPVPEDLIMGDGVHATLQGQMTILRSVVRELAEGA